MWESIKKAAKTAWNWTLRYPLAIVLSVLIILAIGVLLLTGVGDRFNLGGLLGKLWGDEAEDPIRVANEADEDRVDEDGNPIPQGEPDERGWKQERVKKIETRHNPFRDKSVVEVRDAKGEKRKIKLPKGVKDREVRDVIEVQPGEFEVRVESRPDHGLTREDLEEMSSGGQS